MFHPDGPSLLELAQQALTGTTRGYDLLAKKFEYTPFRTPDALLAPLSDAIGGPDSIARALDMCCGTGAGVRALRPLCRDEVVGIDLSAGMLATAHALCDAEQGAPVRLIQGDALTHTFDARFDVITCFGAFGHILEPQQDAFAEAVRAALVPGGRFIFITHLMPPTGSTRWAMARGFNAVMHARNALLKPPFIMFYLTFTLERAVEVLARHGFTFEVRAPWSDEPWQGARLVIATRR
jgi:SAM-dependent methyltransferase